MEVELIAKTCPINGYSDMQVVEQAACVCYNSEPFPSMVVVFRTKMEMLEGMK